MQKTVIILISALLISCQQRELEQSLKLAGSNRPRLEKVLQHYQFNSADSLKYKAAHFLIENMKYQFSLTKNSTEHTMIEEDLKYITDSSHPYSDNMNPLPTSLLTMGNQNCKQNAMLGCYVMHTLGLPVAWDFTPHWANRSMGHDWNVLVSGEQNIPFLLRDRHPLGIAYIMVFDNRNWQPIHWAKIKQNKAIFTKMAAGCMYIAMYYHDGKFHPASDPFCINDTGHVIYAKVNPNKLVTMDLLRKYPDVRMRLFCLEMLGGCFQGSNNKNIRNNKKDTEDLTILYQIETVPEVRWYNIKLNDPQKYRYVRYWAGLESWGNMAEIEFYTSNNREAQKLSGKIIGTGPNFITDGKSTIQNGVVDSIINNSGFSSNFKQLYKELIIISDNNKLSIEQHEREIEKLNYIAFNQLKNGSEFWLPGGGLYDGMTGSDVSGAVGGAIAGAIGGAGPGALLGAVGGGVGAPTGQVVNNIGGHLGWW